MSKNIKMRINKNKESECEFCGEKWKNTPEMYDIMLINDCYTICKACSNELQMKLLKADCLFNGKLKSNEDLARIRNFETKHGHSIHSLGYQVK